MRIDRDLRGLLARRYLSYGLPLIPLREKLKTPIEEDWPDKPIVNEGMLAKWERDRPFHNIGILASQELGVAVLDIDGESGEAVWAEIEKRKGPFPHTMKSKREGASGFRLVIKYNPKEIVLPNIAIPLPGVHQGIELRADRLQTVTAPSIHPDPSDHPEGRIYALADDAAPAMVPTTYLTALIADLTELQQKISSRTASTTDNVIPFARSIPAYLKELSAKGRAVNRAVLVPPLPRPHTPELEAELREILDYQPPPESYPHCRDVGMALYHGTDGADWAFRLWCEWMRTVPGKLVDGRFYPFTEEKWDGLWESFGRPYNKGRKITLDSLYRVALDAGWQPPPPPPDIPPAATIPEAGAPAEAQVNGVPAQPSLLPASPPRDELITIRGDEVEARQLDWLCPGRLATGKITLEAGQPGLGKTLRSSDIAARISRGSSWPCGEGQAPQGDVIILSAEDDIADTLVPRLKAAGADLTRIHFVQMMKTAPTKQKPVAGIRGIDLGRDLEALEAVVKRVKPKLVIIDPISAYMGTPGSGIDSHRNSDVRAILSPLKDLAERYGFAVLAITHLNKSSGTDAMARVTGSGAFIAAARIAFLVCQDKTPGAPPDRRLLLPLKNNLAADVPGRAFTVVTKLVEGVGHQPMIQWEPGVVTATADDVLRAANELAKSGPNPAEEFLRDCLADGPRGSKEITAEGKEHGFTPRQLQLAREKLDIRPTRSGFGSNGSWLWRLPGTPRVAPAVAAEGRSPSKSDA
ncbi:MAG: AAA family ATPase [Hyphomicrobiales bacterium]|nr:AAA family ATPase [Hyphomicrobiales bacterium]